MDIIVIAICGANKWEDVETFAIPSHDTFNRVFYRLDPMEFQNSSLSSISAASKLISGQVIAINGKILRRSDDHGIGKAAIDMAFDEDRSQVRKGYGAENFAVLRHIALNLLKQEKSCKRSIRGKRLLAGWDEKYLLKVLEGFYSLILVRLPWLIFYETLYMIFRQLKRAII